MKTIQDIAKEYLIASLTGVSSIKLNEIFEQQKEITFNNFMSIVDTLDISQDYPLIEMNIFQNCKNAFYHTSFDPEKRALQYLKSYNEELKQDLLTLGESQGNYKDKYISKFLDWMSAKSRCYSVMITGPANFNNSKHEKANNSERNKSEQFAEWRIKYFQAVNRERTKSPEEDLYLAEEQLIKYEERNHAIKEFNKIISKVNRKKSPTIEDVDQCNLDLRELGFLKDGQELESYEWRGKLTVPTIGTYGAKIKKQKERIFELKQRIEIKASFKDIIFEGGKITVEDDRVKIFHDEKPEAEIIQDLKKSGFRWSRHWVCWCRKHTANAIRDAKYITMTKERI